MNKFAPYFVVFILFLCVFLKNVVNICIIAKKVVPLRVYCANMPKIDYDRLYKRRIDNFKSHICCD